MSAANALQALGLLHGLGGHEGGLVIVFNWEADTTYEQVFRLLNGYMVQVQPVGGEPYDAYVDVSDEGVWFKPCDADGEVIERRSPIPFDPEAIDGLYVY